MSYLHSQPKLSFHTVGGRLTNQDVLEIMCVACRAALPAVTDIMGHCKPGLHQSKHCPPSMTVFFITPQQNEKAMTKIVPSGTPSKKAESR